MKMSNFKSVLVLMSILSASGVALADNGSFQFSPQSYEQRASVEELLTRGAITRLAAQDWYQIDASFFQSLQPNSQNFDAEQKRTIDLLKGVTGGNTMIVNLLDSEAVLGSQDSGF